MGKRKILLIICLALSATPVFASPTYDVMLYRPLANGSPYLGVFGSRPLGHRQFSFGLDSSYKYNPLNYKDANDVESRVISHLITMQGGGGIGLWNIFDIGLSLPFAYAKIRPIGDANSHSRIRIGDIAIEGRVNLLDLDRYPLGISILPFVTFPTGSSTNYLGAGGYTAGAVTITEVEFFHKKFGIALNTGYRTRDDVTRDLVKIDDQFLYGLGGRYNISHGFEFIAEIQGTTLISNMFGNTRQTPVIAMGALRYAPPTRKGLSVTAGGSGGVIAGVGVPVAEGLVGGRYVSASRVYMREDIKNRIAMYELAERCIGRKMEGECATISVKEMQDVQKEIVSIVALGASCEAGTVSEGECMKYYALKEKETACPTEYAGFDPQVHDIDCLKAIAVKKIGAAQVLSLVVRFNVGQSKVTKGYMVGLEKLAQFMKDRRGRLKIEGHTDDVGSLEYNKRLSLDRANSARTALIKLGLPADKIEIEGFGFTRPSVEGKAEEARAANRRIEFRFID